MRFSEVLLIGAILLGLEGSFVSYVPWTFAPTCLSIFVLLLSLPSVFLKTRKWIRYLAILTFGLAAFATISSFASVSKYRTSHSQSEVYHIPGVEQGAERDSR